MKMEKKNYPQVYLEESKYKINKIKTPKFINTDLQSESGSESELKSDTESKPKSKLESDFDSEYVVLLFIAYVLNIAQMAAFQMTASYMR